MNENNQIIIYQTEDGQTQVDVRMENETVWLTANQMAMLFERDEKTIRKHINNVFSEGELEKENNTHFLRVDGVKQSVAFYTLDVIISVGYRVKSQRGVKFRQWANRILKQYLVKGYAVNDRLRRDQLGELRQLVQVVGRTLQHQDITATADGQALFDVVVDYTYALDTLDNYDYERLSIERTTSPEALSVLHTIMPWPKSVACTTSSEAANGSVTRRTIHSRAASGRYTRPSEARNSIRRWKRKPPCSFIWLPRTTRSAMATSA